jgi:hypothetical protein
MFAFDRLPTFRNWLHGRHDSVGHSSTRSCLMRWMLVASLVLGINSRGSSVGTVLWT